MTKKNSALVLTGFMQYNQIDDVKNWNQMVKKERIPDIKKKD